MVGGDGFRVAIIINDYVFSGSGSGSGSNKDYWGDAFLHFCRF